MRQAAPDIRWEMPSTKSQPRSHPAHQLTGLATAILEGAGVPHGDAATVAEALVDADREGVTSHGLLMLPLYIDRILGGSVPPDDRSEIVSDNQAVVVLDGGHSLGHVVGARAMSLAIERASRFGLGLCAVRHGFHFGTARRFALQASAEGCIGIVMCNTRPLMPAVGGAERLVGTNPIAIALPTDDPVPLVLDISFAEAAMGKIRSAAQAGEEIPTSWATGPDGRPTSDPNEAIEGMLLPTAGHKGFGMALMIDLMCGLVSGGASGDGVRPLFGDPSVPYDCSQLFLAIDVLHARAVDGFRAEAHAAVERVRSSARAPGTQRIFTPGEPEWNRKGSADEIDLGPNAMTALRETAARVGVDPDRWIGTAEANQGED